MSSQATPTLSLKGIGASPGVAVGHAYILDRRRVRTPKLRLAEAEVDPERMRMKTALDLSDRQLSELKEQITRSEGPEHGHHSRVAAEPGGGLTVPAMRAALGRNSTNSWPNPLSAAAN